MVRQAFLFVITGFFKSEQNNGKDERLRQEPGSDVNSYAGKEKENRKHFFA
jgi:hypothetical protein